MYGILLRVHAKCAFFFATVAAFVGVKAPIKIILGVIFEDHKKS